MDPGGVVLFSATFPGAVPVDVALSGDGSHVAMVAPGNTFQPQLSTIFVVETCTNATDMTGNLGDTEPVAVAFDPSNRVVVQTREPASLWVLDTRGRIQSAVTLSTVSRKDTGHDIFHVQAGGMIACASCHPEGGDDGHVWNLDGTSRRTPSLRGTIAGTAPYHWPGDMKDLPMLFDDVYTRRMSGAKLAKDQVAVLKQWVEAVPAPPAPSWVDSAAATRGKAIFGRASVGCASCHSGAKLTNNETLNVGTGGQFQVPPLVGLGWRAPFLHDGCAASIADRFGSSCATSAHGNTSSLSSGEVSDLVAYLETL
jgi:cytochrome c peroxidase